MKIPFFFAICLTFFLKKIIIVKNFPKGEGGMTQFLYPSRFYYFTAADCLNSEK